ncbi:hypothetical protein RO3G_04108 [Rhizopus delemar RA 99-880]|uniref:Uncharacterized protein n=1 Tax=Rhizopus delemar (strain RA 99-880 / ATCC MYA-4621 / FGSC 9543 / NRRL 43880) TaxID=246409 RepID=I1BT73_RHIO9|nr:hypothetical protein RO3G_04108 [Rhizopus delemar RA 99-880]|eukprot:EIE79403.1 hypothetical protein RO3G_04108 [Rhizopus delemar RA 99-880]
MADILRECEEHRIPFKPGGHLDPEKLVQSNIFKAMSTMNVLSSIGVNPSGFSKLLCS